MAGNLGRGPSAVDDVVQHDAVALTQGKAGSAGLELRSDPSKVCIAIGKKTALSDMNVAIYCILVSTIAIYASNGRNYYFSSYIYPSSVLEVSDND